MSPQSGTVQETPAERALSQVAMQRMQDYQTRWAPMQQKLTQTVEKMGAPGSIERTNAQGRGTLEEGEQFSRAGMQAADADMDRGVGPDSGAFKMGATQMAGSAGNAQGLQAAGADSAIDKAYVGGLQQIMALGRGQSAQAGTSMAQAAGLQSQQAYADAQSALGDRAMWGGAAGTAAGFGTAAATYQMRPQPGLGAYPPSGPALSPQQSAGMFGRGV